MKVKPYIELCKTVFKSIIFSLSIVAFFYAAMVCSVDGYVIEPYYVGISVLFLTLATLSVLSIPWCTYCFVLLFYVVCIIPTLVVSSYIHIYKNFFSIQAFFFIWGSNPGEVNEFIRECLIRFPSLPYWTLACLLVPLAVSFAFIKDIKFLKTIRWYKRLSCGVIMVAILCGLLIVLNAMQYNYILNFYESYWEYSSDKRFVLSTSNANKERIKNETISSLLSSDVKETYVVVIGESASRHHFGMYGYFRLTDPCMQKLRERRELIAFNNVNATVTSTTDSLMRAFSFMDQTTDLKTFKYSILDIFNQAKFSTFWFSNNAVMLKNDTLLQSLSINASERAFMTKNANQELWTMQGGMMSPFVNDEQAKHALQENKKNLTYDDVLLPYLERALNDESPKKIIFLHLKGSHNIYRYRYPNEFEYFTKSDDIPPTPFILSKEAVQIINTYDNSIYYTDYFLSQVKERLEQHGGRSWMLYFSDHGEDVGNREFFGRDLANLNKYMIDVPMMVWFSKEYRENRNLDELDKYVNRPYRLDDLIYSILDIANIKTRLLDFSRSIFSSSYIMRARAIYSNGFHFYLDLWPAELVNKETVEIEKKLDVQFQRKADEVHQDGILFREKVLSLL